MVKRKNRKKFFHQNGVENYDFDFNKEIRKYLFLCGEQMTRKQWKLLQEHEKFYTYEEWKKHIKNKYACYSAKGLREFSKYLNHRMRTSSPVRDFINPMASAIVSSIFTFIITESTSTVGTNLPLIVYVVCALILLIVACIVIGSAIITIAELCVNNNTNENFFKDYKEIIDEIIIQKNKH